MYIFLSLHTLKTYHGYHLPVLPHGHLSQTGSSPQQIFEVQVHHQHDLFPCLHSEYFHGPDVHHHHQNLFLYASWLSSSTSNSSAASSSNTSAMIPGTKTPC